MRIVFFGSGEFAVPSLRWLVNSRHEVAVVVTPPDRPAGRGKKRKPTPVAQQAAEEGLPIEPHANVNDPALVETIRSLGADIGMEQAAGVYARLLYAYLLDLLRANLTDTYIELSTASSADVPRERAFGVYDETLFHVAFSRLDW